MTAMSFKDKVPYCIIKTGNEQEIFTLYKVETLIIIQILDPVVH